MSVEEEHNYSLGVKRKIKTKRGTGTRDQDEITTEARFKSFEDLQAREDEVYDSHLKAIKNARGLSKEE